MELITYVSLHNHDQIILPALRKSTYAVLIMIIK